MAKGFNVLFVTSEVFPYSKTGGLADVSNSLPQALNSLGNDVRIISPKYGQLDERRLQIHEIKRLQQSFSVYNWNDAKLVYPIPQREVQATEGILVQNPGY